MKKRTKIILICIAVLLALIAAVVWWQFENIKSVYYFYKYDSEDIDTMITETKGDVEKYLKENPDYQVRPSEEVEEKLHQAGILSDDELVMVITGQTDVETLVGTKVTLDEKKNFVDAETGEKLPPDSLKKLKEETAIAKGDSYPGNNASSPSAMEPSSGNGNPTGDKTTPQGDASSGNGSAGGSNQDKPGAGGSSEASSANGSSNQDNNNPGGSSNASGENASASPGTQTGGSAENPGSARISACIAQMYVLKSSFSGQLGALYSQAIAEFGALPKSERNEAGKTAIIKKYYPQAASLEQTCDSQVAAILSELEALLIADGQSTELVTKMRTAYYQEKSLTKAQYMNEL